MKTAVSVPDEVFQQAERLARRSGRSRSALYSSALREYVARHDPDEVTAALERALRHVGLDTAEAGFVDAAGVRVLQSTDW